MLIAGISGEDDLVDLRCGFAEPIEYANGAVSGEKQDRPIDGIAIGIVELDDVVNERVGEPDCGQPLVGQSNQPAAAYSLRVDVDCANGW